MQSQRDGHQECFLFISETAFGIANAMKTVAPIELITTIFSLPRMRTMIKMARAAKKLWKM
jgi:hypothetical protein